MARGVWKPKKGAEAAVAHVEDIKAGGIRTLYIRELLQDGGAGDTPVWSRYMGNTPQDLEDPGRVTPQGGLPDGAPSRDVPSVTCSSHGGQSTKGTRTRRCVPVEKRGVGSNRGRKRCGG